MSKSTYVVEWKNDGENYYFSIFLLSNSNLVEEEGDVAVAAAVRTPSGLNGSTNICSVPLISARQKGHPLRSSESCKVFQMMMIIS